MNALLPIHKPAGISTFDLIREFKKAISPNYKIGHAGTLDVFADGLVILLLGGATKTFADFQQHKKTYLATAKLGFSTNTLDSEGEPQKQEDSPKPTQQEISDAIKDFPKEYDQTVPAFSAAKHQGKPLYKHALKGKIIKKSKPVTIHSFALTKYNYPFVTTKTSTSSGTYIRQLSYDLFKKLGLESYLTVLTRTQIGPHTLEAACQIKNLYNDSYKQYLIDQ